MFPCFPLIKGMNLHPVKSMAADHAQTGAVLMGTTAFLPLMPVAAVEWHPRGFGEPHISKTETKGKTCLRLP